MLSHAVRLIAGNGCVQGDVKVGKFRYLVIAAVLPFTAAAAQSIPGTAQPGAVERVLQQKAPELRNDQIVVPAPSGFTTPAGAESFHFTLRRVDLKGAHAVAQEQLAAAYAGLIGREISLADLFEAARRITAAYAQAGYALSFALVPAQNIDRTAGVATIDVVEGYVADIRYEGADVPPALRAFGKHITRARPLKTATLERFLLLMNDLPGTTANAVFERMDNAPEGATRLVIKLARQPMIASLETDNRGSRAFGPWQAGASVTLNSLLGEGESIALKGVRALDANELDAAVLRLTLPLNGNGLSISANATYSDARPGTAMLSMLHFASSGWTASAQLNAPLLRSRAESAWLWGGVSGKWLRSELAATPNSRDRIYALEAGASWAEHDDSGLSAADVTIAQGMDVFGATTGASLLRSRQAGSGAFTSVNLDASRLQRLAETDAGTLDLLATASGQIASRGLLVPNQCGFGGAGFGRGFDNNEIVGDECVMGSIELRYSPLLGNRLGGVADGLQLFAFADAGAARNIGALGAGDKRSDGGVSIGAGLRFRLMEHVALSVEYDKPLGHTVALEGNRDGRIFFQVTLTN